jgi:hypothetical protein
MHRAHLRFPIAHRKVIRTTNLLERLFVEERRRTKIIPNFFHGERPVLKLMYAALIRGAERWRGIHMSVFETRQLEAIRRELDEDHRRRHTAPSTRTPWSMESPRARSTRRRSRSSSGDTAWAQCAPDGISIGSSKGGREGIAGTSGLSECR